LIDLAFYDLHLPGYTIPAGWTIMLVTPIVHLNPETYKDPLKFNPWRWKVCHFIMKSFQDKNKTKNGNSCLFKSFEHVAHES
jgi:cytochrome P450